jgi:hypothetical protein
VKVTARAHRQPRCAARRPPHAHQRTSRATAGRRRQRRRSRRRATVRNAPMNHFTAISARLLRLVRHLRHGAEPLRASRRQHRRAQRPARPQRRRHPHRHDPGAAQRQERGEGAALATTPRWRRASKSFTLSEKTFQSNTLPEGRHPQGIGLQRRGQAELDLGSARQHRRRRHRRAAERQPRDRRHAQRHRQRRDPHAAHQRHSCARSTSRPTTRSARAQVADARISITGEGANTRQVTRGPVGQLFDTLVWAAWPF